ncbi:MAG TPA: hypothetical protein VJ965_01050, partial [Anaerolineales bacterium]|nr:hypothetical protein [Anaerolineales bacterium]
PDGDKILFYSKDNDAGEDLLRIIDLSTMEITVLAHGDGGSWSPNSDKIVFYSDYYTTTNQVFVVNVDGSNLVQITGN